MHKKIKTIFHIDMDSYFVNAIITLNPELKNKDVAICNMKNTSIVSSLSYEAKKKGAKVPMALFKVKQFCPNIIAIKPNFELFNLISNNIFTYLTKKYTNKIEVVSIDECYLDVTNILEKYQNSLELAKEIQSNILKEFKIPCSIGISYNKFLAKMASPMNKPYGIKILDKNNFKDNIYNLKLKNFYGIGKSSIKKLNAKNIFYIKDLLNEKDEILFKNIFGKRWIDIKQNVLGNGNDELILEHNELQEIGNEKTFNDTKLDDREKILDILKNLAFLVSKRAIQRYVYGFVITIHIRYFNFENITLQKSLNLPINDFETIYEYGIMLFNQIWNENPLRLIGIKISKLINIFENPIQTTLFENNIKKLTKIDEIVDNLNINFSKKIVFKANLFPNKNINDNSQTKFLKIEKNINK